MNKIKMKSDVLAWARTIVDGKGEKYIPLGKADMFAIAKYIIDGLANAEEPSAVPTEVETKADKPDAPSDKAVGDAAEEKKAEGEVKPTAADAISPTPTGAPATTKVTMTRGYALHRAGFSTQAAYDKFLEWSKEHPKEGTVMDFSTGVKSNNAAFAYWLMENISAEVPTSEMRADY